MNNIRVLCVESHIDQLDALKYMLEAAGYEVVAASIGSQAIATALHEHGEGVMLEYDLPDATGSAVREEMKRIKPEIPVLLFAEVGSQTPFLLRLFDLYLREDGRPEPALRDFDA